MKMELIQPFINAADAVLAQNLRGTTRVRDLNMDEGIYRRKGIAAMVAIQGDIEGQIVFDMEPQTAITVANIMAGLELPETDELVRETVCELANQIIGNAVTSLNDQGFNFKVFPPQVHASDEGLPGNEDTEALVMCIDTAAGTVYMNIGMHYQQRREECPVVIN
jgi:chemotaxis protein CheX